MHLYIKSPAHRHARARPATPVLLECPMLSTRGRVMSKVAHLHEARHSMQSGSTRRKFKCNAQPNQGVQTQSHAPANPTSLAFEFRPANLAYYARGKTRLPDTSQGLHHPDRRQRDTVTGDGPFAQHLWPSTRSEKPFVCSSRISVIVTGYNTRHTASVLDKRVEERPHVTVPGEKNTLVRQTPAGLLCI